MAARLGKTSAKKILPEEVRKKMLRNVAGAHSLTLIFCLICGTGRERARIIHHNCVLGGNCRMGANDLLQKYIYADRRCAAKLQPAVEQMQMLHPALLAPY